MEPQLQSAAAVLKSAPGSGWRGLGRGLLPLLILAGGIAATLVLTLTARELATGIDITISQWIVVGVFALGLAITGVAYGIALVRTFRRWRTQLRDSGHESNASSAGILWAMLVTAVVVAMPVIVAAFIPQHPAP